MRFQSVYRIIYIPMSYIIFRKGNRIKHDNKMNLQYTKSVETFIRYFEKRAFHADVV